MLLFVSIPILILAPYHHFSLSQPLDKKALPIEIDVNDLTNEYSILDIYSLLAEKFSKEVIDDMVDDSVNGVNQFKVPKNKFYVFHPMRG